MTTFNVTSQAMGIDNFASGSFTSDNTIATLKLGFVPRFFKFFNSTDTISWEKFEGMAANACIKTTGVPAVTNDTTGAITFNSDGTVALAAAAVGNGKAISWVAMA